MQINRVPRGSYIQGQFERANDPNGELAIQNPGDLEQNPVAFPFTYEHVGEAVAAAKRSFPNWKRMPPSDRNSALLRYRELLKKRSEDLAAYLCFEIGKPLWEARTEVADCIELVDYFLKQGSQTTQEIKVPEATNEGSGVVRFFSRGVMAVIAAANEPLFSVHGQMLPSLINGNTVIIKSAREAPFSAQCMAEIINDAGLPAGVVNVVHGDSEVLRRLVTSPDIDGVFFTGSYEAGLEIKKNILSDYWKMLVLNMGGKNSLVVWDDAQYEKALYESVLSAYVTTGQRDTCADRLIVHEKIFDRFVDDFHKLSKKCKIGYGMTDGPAAPFMGPMASEAGLEHYLRYQGIAVREGCEEIMRGKPLEKDKRGYYVSPSMHYVKKPDAKSVYQKSEIFGPNVAIYKVKDLEEVSEIVNLTQYGLVASIYSQKRENYQHLTDELKVSALHWNRPTINNWFRLPFGGLKRSGNHRPMGSFAGYQCTYAISSLEHEGDALPSVPSQLPRLEGA